MRTAKRGLISGALQRRLRAPFARSLAAAWQDSWPAVPRSVSEIRRVMVRYARSAGASPRALGSVGLAVTEAATNVVVHAFPDEPGRILVSAEVLDNDVLRVVVADKGTGTSTRPDSPGLGLGLPLISQLTSHLEIVADEGGGTDVLMDFPLAA